MIEIIALILLLLMWAGVAVVVLRMFSRMEKEEEFRRADHPETAKRRGRQHPKGDNSAAQLEGTKYQRTDRSLSGHTFE